jgi:hypothetical protein
VLQHAVALQTHINLKLKWIVLFATNHFQPKKNAQIITPLALTFLLSNVNVEVARFFSRRFQSSDTMSVQQRLQPSSMMHLLKVKILNHSIMIMIIPD